MFTFETARSETPDNITFRLTNVIPERIIFVSRGITVYIVYKCGRGTQVGPMGYRLDDRRNRSSIAGRNRTCASPPPQNVQTLSRAHRISSSATGRGASSPETKWPGWEGDRLLPSSAMTKLHCHVGNSLPLYPVLRKLHQMYTLRPHLLKKCFNLIFL